MEDRIERLESIVAQQERTMEQLNEVICNQQKQIDEQEKVLNILATKFKELAHAADATPQDVPPPHYGR